MEELKGTNVAAPVVPFTSEDKYATHDARYGKGGFRSVATIAERDAIPADRKTEGMVVRVQADKKHYVWESNAWAEWLPKGNVTVDTALNVNSNNAVSNKATTTGINAATSVATAAQAKANAAIPKTDIVTDMNAAGGISNTKVPSTKAVADAIDTFGVETTDAINRVSEIATKANTTANNAIPKSKIAAESDNIVSSDTTQVPSSKAISTLFTGVTELFNDGLDAVNVKATNAQNTANAAIPKANIAQVIPGNTTRQDLVPSAKAVNDAITYMVNNIPKITIDASLSTTSVNPVQNKVVTAELNGHTTAIQILSDNITLNQEGITAIDKEVQSHKNQIGIVTNNLAPIKSAWDKKNAANGLVQLDAGGKLPAASLPAGYDNIDMLVAFIASNPTTGMTIGQKWYVTSTKLIFTATSATSGSTTMPEGNEKIYINTSLNKSYRWTGSDMVVVGDGSGIALGTTASTAFRGDYGNTLYINFGSGANLTATQKARSYFNAVDSSEKVITGINTSKNAEQVSINVYGRMASTGVGAAPNAAVIQKASATEAGVMTADMYKTLQELELQAFPLTLNLTGAGVFEVGQSTKNPIAIGVIRKGANVTSTSTVTVNPPSGTTGSLSSGKNNWVPTNNITGNTTVSVTAAYGAQTQTKSISYTFKYRKYWGVSDKATLTNADVLAMAGSTWADSRTMGATRFDCTGGKYPYYVIPANLYTGLEMWVGGLKNTDLVVTDMQVTNASGATSAYKVIRLNNKQTGVLSVEFK